MLDFAADVKPENDFPTESAAFLTPSNRALIAANPRETRSVSVRVMLAFPFAMSYSPSVEMMMKTALRYLLLPIDNSALSLRSPQGRREVVRAFVQAVFALLALGFSVACIAAIITAGVTFLLLCALAFCLSILAVPILTFFGVLSIFPSRR